MNNKISLGGNIFPMINFAMHQNYVPIIRNLVLTNETDESLEDISLRISFEPAFAHPYETLVGILEPETPIEVSPVKINIIPDYLLALTEKMIGNIHIEISGGNETIFTQDETIELLAYDEWSGALMMPEMICAFVTPNHPKVTEVVSKASVYLNKWLGSPSFTGYQSGNPNIIKNQMAALYSALHMEGIAYNMPPASYEKLGQRVRYPGTVLEQKVGTCLDLSTLYASCLEAVGLNPIIVIVKGHAVCGCWLDDESFSECIQDDVSTINKRVSDGINEICLVECTNYVAGSDVSFDNAAKNGNRRVAEPKDFLLAVDVKRSRASGIRPVPMRVVVEGAYSAVDYGESKNKSINTAPGEIDITNRLREGTTTAVTKQAIWERKLLDLSLRNMLLSFRVTRNTVQLMAGSLATLEDALSGGESFKLLPKPSDWENTLRDSKIYLFKNEKDAIEQLAQAEFHSKRIRTFLDENELTQNILSLYRNAKVSIEENGSNTLYLALGFLRWYETDISERARYSPLVLLPVEITKRVTSSEFVVKIRDEEPQMNITLLEMLKQDFGIIISGLDPLPADESGIDLKLVFNTIRQAVMAKKRWDVDELAFLGLFSFSQYIMWNDIRTRSSELAENKIVKSLISGKMEWEPGNDVIPADELDVKLMPNQLAVPTSADSSQMVAISAAASGSSFVLHGPPGTGKSQTITNVIANALFQGKSVLFVAQKMAALSVVQKRLAAIGIDPFCLELHSNKARKKDVLHQLENTLSIGRIKSPDDYAAKAETLRVNRSLINKTVSEIHKKRNYGFSIYEAIALYEKSREYKNKVAFTQEQIENMTGDSYADWKSSLERLAIASYTCGDNIPNHPLRLFQDREYSLDKRDQITDTISVLMKNLKELQNSYDEVCNICNIEKEYGYRSIQKVSKLIESLLASSLTPESTLANLEIRHSFNKIKEVCSFVDRRKSITTEILDIFASDVFNYDAASALSCYKTAQQSWFLPKMLGIGKLVKELRSYANNPSSITKSNLPAVLQKLHERSSLAEDISKNSPEMSLIFDELWKGDESYTETLLQAYENSIAIQEHVKELVSDASAQKLVLGKLARITSKENTIIPEKLKEFSECERSTENIVGKMKNDLKINMDETLAYTNWISGTKEQLEIWEQNLNGIRAWSAFLSVCDEINAKGLNNITEAQTKGELSANEIIPAFECNLFYKCAIQTISNVSELSSFQGVQFNECIRKFKELSKEFEILTINELVAKLSEKIPTSSAGLAGSSEIGILQRSIKSGGRMMPIRKLFDSVPNLIRRLCPCMLMSPISVAQYIDPSFPKFDLVIFDEASQVPTCEAVGAIARGSNVLVVGDPKQLPPTSFFSSNKVDEENFDKEDLESLLDDCLALSMPQEHLLWHYRSRHESLIAYSNQKYYDNRLFTFPSPNDMETEVEFIPVDGVYDRGNTKHNRLEAEAVVAEICRRLSDSTLRNDSIGVVTFSSVQQHLIDDLLTEAFRKNPVLDDINNSCAEPIFIKNLENVQGDERDIILFSIGYGPDKNGYVAMNFGPLNRDGGWRRLNVAITRARKHMMVFSTLRPEQIDLSRTRAEGLAGLKGFLEYATGGKSSLAQNSYSVRTSGLQIEQVIAHCIKKLGYDAVCNIGCSGYKIDIGIVNPKDSKHFILGVMCDGNGYRDASTASDRNIIQPNVLSSLGWNLHRVWILDWLDNPEEELSKIDGTLKRLLKNQENVPETSDYGTIYTKDSNTAKSLPDSKNRLFAASDFLFEKMDTNSIVNENQKIYTPLTITSTDNTEAFYQPQTIPNIRRVIEAVVEKEAPISRKNLGRKVLSAWGITRSGSRVDSVIERALLSAQVKKSKSNNTVFYWSMSQEPIDYVEFRIPAGDDEKRSLDDICSEEIANGLKCVMQVQISLTNADLIRETAKIFGFTRKGGIIDSAVQNGIEEAVNRGYITVSEDGGRITLA